LTNLEKFLEVEQSKPLFNPLFIYFLMTQGAYSYIFLCFHRITHTSTYVASFPKT